MNDSEEKIQAPNLFPPNKYLLPFDFVTWRLTDCSLPLIFINGDPESAKHCYIGNILNNRTAGSIIPIGLRNINTKTAVATAFIGDFFFLVNPTLMSTYASQGDRFRLQNLQYKIYLYPNTSDSI